MRQMANIWKTAAIAVTSTLLFLTAPVQASALDEEPSAGAIVADAVVVRPIYFALSQVGSVVYTATLPFTLLGGNADEVAETLVVTPLQGAFVRCLGCGKIDNEVGKLSEIEGSKKIKHFVELNGGGSFYKFNNKSDKTGTFGIHAGTNFALVDGSRFDLAIGYQQLVNDPSDDDLVSYQIINRFGRQLGNSSVDIMFKLGGHYYDLDKANKNGFGFLGGVGLNAWASDNIRVGAEYTLYGVNKLPNTYNKSYLGTATLNLGFMF